MAEWVQTAIVYGVEIGIISFLFIILVAVIYWPERGEKR